MSLHSDSSSTTPQHEHAEIARLGTATVCESRGLALAGSFRRIAAGSSVAGPARLVSCPSGDNRAVHAAELTWPGEVPVIAMPEPNNFGIIGGLLATQMQHRGAAGAVVDGSVRAAAQLHELGLPAVWAGVAVPGTTKSGPVDTTEVVAVGEVQIKAGDIVVADADAVVVVDSGEGASMLETGRQRDRPEAELRPAIAARATTFDLLGLGS